MNKFLQFKLLLPKLMVLSVPGNRFEFIAVVDAKIG
jgi:hypothetical protein